jgi:uncharacterized Fe-S cluster-containing radical SAM superfamily protein
MLAAPVAKFSHPDFTAKRERRAAVALGGLRTLWFNTGTLCNLSCENCYIESSPRNDRLVYLSREEVRTFLAEARERHPELVEVGFTGGEPFMNPELLGMLEDALSGGWKVLVLTNAMRPMQRLRVPLLKLQRRHPGRMTIRVSLDHYTRAGHETVRGPRSWEPTMAGLRWLVSESFELAVASRLMWEEGEAETRSGFAGLFMEEGLPISADDASQLVLFPEMDASLDVPEITEACWDILGKSPSSVMCASSRMVVKHKGSAAPSVIACTLLPYEPEFDLGGTLASAERPVKLNHPHCAKFCVLGGASCSV